MNASKIFNHQRGLIAKFHPIEQKNFPHRYHNPFCHDLDDPQAQDRIRDYAWRITEEVVEATMAPNQALYIEELIDVLHFVTELFIFLEIQPEQLHLGTPGLQFEPASNSDPMAIVISLGKAVNLLKNKAWKQSMKHTDQAEFYNAIRQVWFDLQHELTLCGLSPSEIQDAYMDKNLINHNRHTSGV